MKRVIKQVRWYFADNWRVGLFWAISLAILVGLLLFKLGSLVHGLSDSEFAIQQQVASDSITPETLLRNPLHLPYYLLLYLVELGPFQGPTAIRGVSALFGLAGGFGFFYILQRWYTPRVALFGTILFVTSSWFLHTARLASPDSSYLLLPLFIAAAVYLQAHKNSRAALITVTVLGLFAMYLPGLIWFLLPAAVLQRRVIRKSLSLQPLWVVIGLAIVTVVVFIPLVAMIAWPFVPGRVGASVLALLGLPANIPSVSEFTRNGFHTLAQIFVFSNRGPQFTVGHLPLLDICTAFLAFVGTYQFGKYLALDRSKLLFMIGIVGLILIATGGPVAIALLLPFVYFLAVEGLKWLLDSWLSVFPRNPVARGFAVTVVALLVATTSFYHLDRYFQAWAHTPETRAVFTRLP